LLEDFHKFYKCLLSSCTKIGEMHSYDLGKTIHDYSCCVVVCLFGNGSRSVSCCLVVVVGVLCSVFFIVLFFSGKYVVLFVCDSKCALLCCLLVIVCVLCCVICL
jgi:hypothetical protein